MVEAGPVPSTRDLANLWRTSPNLTAILDREGRLLVANTRWERMLGWPPTELVGREFARVVHEDDRPRFGQLLARLRDGADHARAELRLCRHGGGWSWFQVNAAGADDRIYLIATDVDRHRALEEELARRNAELHAATERLREVNTELREFASVLSHDLREPMRKVASYAELLLRRYGDGLEPQAAAYARTAADAARRLQAMLDELLEYARAGGDAEPTAVELGELLEEVLSDLSVQLRVSGTTVESGPLPTVWANRAALTRVLHNLITNSIRHRGDRTVTIRIDAEKRADDTWELRISDDGPGMAPEDAAHLFEVRSRPRHRRDGLGLGLPIVRRLVERMGGRVRATSAPGEGTTVTVTLPRPPSDVQRGGDG